jgi:hypothetical protein
MASAMHYNMDAFSVTSRSTPIRDFIGSTSPPTSPLGSSAPNSPMMSMNSSGPKVGHVLPQVSSKPPIYPAQPAYPAPVLSKSSPSNSQTNLSSHYPQLQQQHIPPQRHPTQTSTPNGGHAFQPYNPQNCFLPSATTPTLISQNSHQHHRSASVSLLNTPTEEMIHPPKPSKTPPPSQTYSIAPCKFL